MGKKENIMSTPVERVKRDRGRVGLHNESYSIEVACGRDGKKEGGMNQTIPEETRENSRNG